MLKLEILDLFFAALLDMETLYMQQVETAIII